MLVIHSYAVRRAASKTPPVVPNISAAPVDSPRGISKGSSSKLAKSMPASLIILANSLVVIDISTSGILSWPNSFLEHSYFLATQGITETTYIFLGSIFKTFGAR